jgi:hypothetical protein
MYLDNQLTITPNQTPNTKHQIDDHHPVSNLVAVCPIRLNTNPNLIFDPHSRYIYHLDT